MEHDGGLSLAHRLKRKCPHRDGLHEPRIRGGCHRGAVGIHDCCDGVLGNHRQDVVSRGTDPSLSCGAWEDIYRCDVSNLTVHPCVKPLGVVSGAPHVKTFGPDAQHLTRLEFRCTVPMNAEPTLVGLDEKWRSVDRFAAGLVRMLPAQCLKHSVINLHSYVCRQIPSERQPPLTI